MTPTVVAVTGDLTAVAKFWSTVGDDVCYQHQHGRTVTFAIPEHLLAAAVAAARTCQVSVQQIRGRGASERYETLHHHPAAGLAAAPAEQGR